MAVVAGTPEWFGPPMEEFYTRVREGELPLLVLGVGYIDSPINFTEDELYCFKNHLKVATFRDEYASRALAQININHEILPCPALFASKHENIPNNIGRIGFILQTNRTVNQSVAEELS